MTRRASENGRQEGTKAGRVDLSGVLLVRVAGRWSWNHKSTGGGGGGIERQTSRGEDLRKDDVADGGEGAEKPSCEIWSTEQKKRMKGMEGEKV